MNVIEGVTSSPYPVEQKSNLSVNALDFEAKLIRDYKLQKNYQEVVLSGKSPVLTRILWNLRKSNLMMPDNSFSRWQW